MTAVFHPVNWLRPAARAPVSASPSLFRPGNDFPSHFGRKAGAAAIHRARAHNRDPASRRMGAGWYGYCNPVGWNSCFSIPGKGEILKPAAKALLASFPLFRLFGVPVRAHFTWLLFVAGYMVLGSWGHRHALVRALDIGLIVVLVFGSLLVHEFGHVFVARRHGCHASRIVMLPIGCAVILEEPPRAPYELWMALAGPLASAALAIASGFGWIFLDIRFRYEFDAVRSILGILFEFNLLLAAFNLVPCFPMDGGRIARSLLARIIGRFSRRRETDALVAATFIAVRCIAWPAAIGAVALCFFTGGAWPYYIFIFGLLLVAGEAELWVLRDSGRPVPIAPERPPIPPLEAPGIPAGLPPGVPFGGSPRT